MNLFTDNKTIKRQEQYNKTKEKLYKYLKEQKFTLTNEQWITKYTKQSRTDIQIFEYKCRIDKDPNNVEYYNDFYLYRIYFKPHEIIYEFKEKDNQNDFDIKELEQDYKDYINIKKEIETIFNSYYKEIQKILNENN